MDDADGADGEFCSCEIGEAAKFFFCHFVVGVIDDVLECAEVGMGFKASAAKENAFGAAVGGPTEGHVVDGAFVEGGMDEAGRVRLWIHVGIVKVE